MQPAAAAKCHHRVVLSAALGAALALILQGCAARQTTADAIIAKAERHFDAGEYNAAYAAYRQANRLQPDNVHVLIRLAETCLWLRDPKRGLAWIDEALKRDPDSALAHEKKGELLLADQRPNDALAHLKKALSLDGNLNVARLNMSLAYQALGDSRKAVEVAQLATQFNPRDAEAHFRYGAALEATGRTEQAEDEYRLALSLNPDHIQALRRLARLLVRRRQELTEARKLAQRAYELRPGDGDAAVLAAWTLYLQGDKRSAAQELDQVARAHPANFQAWALLSRVLGEIGQKRRARLAARIAAQLAPRRPAPSRRSP